MHLQAAYSKLVNALADLIEFDQAAQHAPPHVSAEKLSSAYEAVARRCDALAKQMGAIELPFSAAEQLVEERRKHRREVALRKRLMRLRDELITQRLLAEA